MCPVFLSCYLNPNFFIIYPFYTLSQALLQDIHPHAMHVGNAAFSKHLLSESKSAYSAFHSEYG